MNSLQDSAPRISAMSQHAVDNVRKLEAVLRESPQFELETRHVIHGGMYSRTIRMPAQHILTGTLVKVPTLLIISGHVTVYLGDGHAELIGYGVVPASAGRKQAFVSHMDTDISMVFCTSAKTVSEAEAELTDEVDLLVSRSDQGSNFITITGE